MKILRFVLQIALGIALPLSIQLWHRRRLAPAQRAVAWNGATWGAALYAFGPLSLLGWFVVTRGSLPFARIGRVLTGLGLGAAVAFLTRFARVGRVLAGLGLGTVAALLILLVIYGVDQVVALALGLPP